MSLLHNVSEHTRRDEDSRLADSSDGARKRGRAEPPTPPENPAASTGGSLTRVTANFTPRAMKALDQIATETGDSKTDILNKSVMIYEAFLELLERSGGNTLTVKLPDGDERLRFFV